MAKIDKSALAEAVHKTAKLRVEDVGGQKERSALTVKDCLERGYPSLGSTEGISYILRHAIKYYLDASEAVSRAEAAEAKVKLLEPIVQAVAHIGVDFGYGPYELEPHFIGDARSALSGGTSNG